MILFFTRTVPHYLLDFFRELNKNLGVVVCFGRKGPSNNFFSKVIPEFPHYQMGDFYPLSKKENLVIQNAIKPLIKFKPKVVIVEFTLSILTNWLLLFLSPLFKYKLILRTHGCNSKAGLSPERSFLDRVRIWWMNRADAIVVYSQYGKSLIVKYVNVPQKVFVGQNSLYTNRLIKIRDELLVCGKDNIEKELRFTAKYNLIYVGRLLKEKEPDRLLEVFNILQKKLSSIALHIVGDGPLFSQLKKQYTDSNIHFLGTIIDDYKVGKLLFASDLMVIPSHLGLAIVHAFCFDTPVLSQKIGKNGSSHGPEIEYLIDGKTGFLVEYGNNGLMADSITSYLLDDKKKDYMRQEIRKVVNEKCNFDKMLQGFIAAINYVRSK